MSTKRTRVCDGCGAESTSTTNNFEPALPDASWSRLMVMMNEFDLCEQCTDTIAETIKLKLPSKEQREAVRVMLAQNPFVVPGPGPRPPAMNLVGGALSEEELKELGLKL